MNLSITTTANNGHIILYVIDSNGLTIIQLKDSDSGMVMLVPGYTYRFEWHVWSPNAADYTIRASIDPENHGFLPFDYSRQYESAHRDMGGFYFSL